MRVWTIQTLKERILDLEEDQQQVVATWLANVIDVREGDRKAIERRKAKDKEAEVPKDAD